ncbi:MAG: LptF/LptG family permease [Phycisphaeraceae bacterium]|nr:LptF/LptG family permease [Phycisphaeraceae bacterium]
MLARPPIIIWTYISVALWRLIVVSALVIVSVLAFAGAVKFMADGKLGPIDTLKFMAFAMLPMLEYGLPFAAGFAATMAYHRFAVDNEVGACQAGGMSHRSLLGPAMLAGLGLFGILLYLSNSLIPLMLRQMQELAYKDVTRLVVSSLRAGRPISLQGMMVTADVVESLGADKATGAYEVLWLSGVTVVKMDKSGKIEAEGTAKNAWVWFIWGAGPGEGAGPEGPSTRLVEDDGSTLVVMRAEKPHMHQPGKAAAEEDFRTFSQRIPSPVQDDTKFLSWSELEDRRARPELMQQVEQKRRTLAATLGERATTQRMAEAMARSSQVTLTDPGGLGWTITAPSMRWTGNTWWELAPPGGSGPVRVERHLPGGGVQVMSAKRALFHTYTDPNAADREITLTLRLENVSVSGASTEPGARQTSPTAGVHPELEFQRLALRDSPVPNFLAMPTAELVTLASEAIKDDPNPQFVDGPRKDLEARITRLNREVTGKQQERLSMAAACLVMVITGSVMAMRLKDSLPLAVYLWSFLPALACLMGLIAGRQLIFQNPALGVTMMWSGVLGLGVFTLLEYRKLALH